MNRHDDPSGHKKQPDAQHQPPFPARPSDTSVNDFDHFPFLPVTENPAQQGSYSGEKIKVQDRSRRLQRLLGQVLLTLGLVVLAFWGGWLAHQYFSQTFDLNDQSRSYSQLIQQAWTDIDQHYVDRKAIDYKKMSHAAIAAMVTSLGDTAHSHFADPQQAQHENQEVGGKYAGIGFYFQQNPTTQQWTVDQIIPNGPGDQAGLKPYDIVKSINGVDINGKDADAAGQLIKGSAGTKVTFVIQRPGESRTRTVTITIAEIDSPNVLMYYIPESHIADIQVVMFTTGVSENVRADINKAKAMGATKFIIDLRGDPGGSLDEAVKISSLFISSGNVLIEQDSSGQRTSEPVFGNPLDTTSPIVILVNTYSISAAEILTGAFQDNHRAIVIGTKTFGTGTILFPYALADGSELYLGTQEWLTPNGRSVRRVAGDPNSGGIKPDIEVKPNQSSTLTPNEEQRANMNQQQILTSGDTQLVAAIQYLNQQK